MKIGDPSNSNTTCGPLHNKQALEIFSKTIKKILQNNGKIIVGGEFIRLSSI